MGQMSDWVEFTFPETITKGSALDNVDPHDPVSTHF
jgi:hypothetical protein